MFCKRNVTKNFDLVLQIWDNYYKAVPYRMQMRETRKGRRFWQWIFFPRIFQEVRNIFLKENDRKNALAAFLQKKSSDLKSPF